jgi:hypothetical protein
MGSSASLVHHKLQDHPELLKQYQDDLADLFASSYHELAALPTPHGTRIDHLEAVKEGESDDEKEDEKSLSKERREQNKRKELQKKFEEILKKNELQLMMNIARAEQMNQEGELPLPSRESGGEQQRQEGLQKGKNKKMTRSGSSSSSNSRRQGLNFLVCVNGTTAGDLGYRSTLRLMNKMDTITLFNAYNSATVAQLPLKYHPKQIRDHYQSQLLNTLSSEQVFFYFADCDLTSTGGASAGGSTSVGGSEITTVLRNYIELYHPDLTTTMSYLNDYTLDKLQEPLIQQPSPDFVVIGKNRFILDKIESGILEDPTEAPPLQHPQTIQRVNSGPMNHSHGTTTLPPTVATATWTSPSGKFDDLSSTAAVPVGVGHSHPPLLSKSSRGESGSFSFRDSDSDKDSRGGDGGVVGYTLLGSSDISLEAIHLPCIIIKTPLLKPSSHSHLQSPTTASSSPSSSSSLPPPLKYLLAVNETLRSRRGLDLLKKLLNPRDTLQLLYVSSRDTTETQLQEIRSYYHHELSHHSGGCPLDSTLKIIAMTGRMLPDVILEYALETHCDFLAVSPRAREERGGGRKEAMSVTEQILLKSNCNVILCKN